MRWLKRIAIVVGLVLAIFALVGAAGAIWVDHLLDASLPILDGEVGLDGLSAPVTVERDDLGVPTIRGANRLDVGRATGFVHGQERFFQMDLLRRRAAGELAELIGRAVVAEDRRNRMHRLRSVAQARLASVDDETAALIEAYTSGVNAGLDALGAAPPEYAALRVEPRPWVAADTLLVVLSMYLELQDERGWRESNLGLMAELLPRELFEFLATPGTEWDAPLIGEAFHTPPVPSAQVFDLRAAAAVDPPQRQVEPDPISGSNGWAVAGMRTEDGRALLANDMHLPHAVPNIWFRASLVWPDENGGEHRVTGVMLPGTPPIIVGSNGHVAWGFTNSQVDLSDLVVLEPVGEDEERYATPVGPRTIEHVEERILVKGEQDELLDIEQTIWGPVIDRDHRGRRRAMRWVAHDVEGVDLGLIEMELARDLDQALEIATRVRIPTQNCQIADSRGRIGWTLIGPLPRRKGFSGGTPRSWATGQIGWDGYLTPGEHPRVVDPGNGLIWTANNRVVGREMLELVGDGGLVLGARARQIRDDLMALERASEEEMLEVQLDDRALFLERWRTLLLDALESDAARGDARREELKRLVDKTWTGRASVDSVSFRMVRAFRLYLMDQVFGALTAACEEADERFNHRALFQLEGPMWKLLTERPRHLLDPRFQTWDEQLVAAIDELLERFAADEGALAERTWGERNTVRVQHPISMAVPQLSRWLDIPPEQLPGAGQMPRVQSPRFGASMRMTVSPGREEQGLLHMPGGQSGHPRSPFYGSGHAAWVHGSSTPFLPGSPTHHLSLTN